MSGFDMETGLSGLALASPRTEENRARLQQEVAAVMVVLGRKWRARLTELLREAEQTDARWNVLHTLARSPSGTIQAELADAVGVQGPTLVKLLDALESQGLIRRQTQPTDRRAKAVYLEPKGAEMLETIDRIAADFRDRMFDGASDEELSTVLRVFDRISQHLAAD
jgi:MarR family transcriptional regulator, transcriptional regulator for hemolysin